MKKNQSYIMAWKRQEILDNIYYAFNSGITFVNTGLFNTHNIWDTYIISDTHFNHYPKTWDWPGRQPGWEQRMIDNWNSKVPKDGKVIHLGDFSFGSKDKAFASRNKLNGEIYLIKGNHDRHGAKWYKDIGINLIKKNFAVATSGEIFVFSHRPIVDKMPNGMVNIHGHVHVSQDFLTEGHVNMSVEKTNFTPMKFPEIVALWRKYNFQK